MNDPQRAQPRYRGDQGTGVASITTGTQPIPPSRPPNGDGGGAPPQNPDVAQRKFEAKRHNEGVKVFATWMNALSGITIGAAAIIPAVSGAEGFARNFQVVWYFIGLALHGVGQAALRFEMRSEE